MSRTGKISASLQDYLEAIFHIISEKGGVRAKDIAVYLGVKAGSVTTALKSLARNDYVNYETYEVITLTDKGLEEAKYVIEKHEKLKNFFVEVLGADSVLADSGACKIEHVIPNELVERLVSFADFIRCCPNCRTDNIKQFKKKFRFSFN